MNLSLWVVFGLITGALAKFIMPGEQHGGRILTVVLGIAGAVVGGFISTHMLGFGDVTGFDLRSMVIAVGGALLVLVVYGVFSRRHS
jgi:uncharacterized membrane protein YeaQ/YmgE (transglycosylase-associated protein family)